MVNHNHVVQARCIGDGIEIRRLVITIEPVHEIEAGRLRDRAGRDAAVGTAGAHRLAVPVVQGGLTNASALDARVSGFLTARS